MWNSGAPSHTPLSCIFVVDQCDRGECGKNGSFGTKNALMETMKRKNKERGKERATKKYLLFPGERRWLFAENGGIISYFPLFLAHIWGATQYLCYWDTSEMHLSVAPPTYNRITVLGVFKQFKVIQPSSHLPLASCWTVKLLFVANLPSLASTGPLMSNTALIIIDSPQSVYQKDIWFLSVFFRKGNEVKWRFLLIQQWFPVWGPARKNPARVPSNQLHVKLPPYVKWLDKSGLHTFS